MGGCGRLTVGVLAVGADVGEDGGGLASFGSEIEEELGRALFAICVFSEWIYDPDLTQADRGGECGAVWVARDELVVLDALALFRRGQSFCSFEVEVLTLGIVMVLMIVRVGRSHRRTVFPCTSVPTVSQSDMTTIAYSGLEPAENFYPGRHEVKRSYQCLCWA